MRTKNLTRLHVQPQPAPRSGAWVGVVVLSALLATLAALSVVAFA